MSNEFRGLADEPVNTGPNAHILSQPTCDDPDARFAAAVLQLLPILTLMLSPLIFFHPLFAVVVLLSGPLMCLIAWALTRSKHPFTAAAGRQVLFFQTAMCLIWAAGFGIGLFVTFIIFMLLCFLAPLAYALALIGAVVIIGSVLMTNLIVPILAARTCFRGELFAYPISYNWATQPGDIAASAVDMSEGPPSLL